MTHFPDASHNHPDLVAANATLTLIIDLAGGKYVFMFTFAISL